MINTLKERWLQSGIEPGDTVLLHSDITRTVAGALRAGVFLKPEDVLASFLEALGPKGTLLAPLFNFDFADGAPFDMRTTPSHMGAVTEAARLYDGAVRTGHPMYSFAVIGAKAGEFEGVNNESGYAEDSPFGMLKRMNGKAVILDLEDDYCMTFYHHVEEIKRVPYRYFKPFSGRYTDMSGAAGERTYKLYVRDLEKGVRTKLNPAGEMMWREGLYKGSRPWTGAGLRAINLREMFEFVAGLIDDSKALGTLYIIEGQP